MGMEWELIFFTVFVCLGCGTFVSSVIMTEWAGLAKPIRTKTSLVALAALAAGGLASVLHLGHPERIFGALGHPTSGIFMESTMLGLVGLDIIIYLIGMRRKASERTLKIIASVGIIPAVILAFAVGYTYVLSARPAWDTVILPLNYLASAAIVGCFSVGLLIALTEKEKSKLTLTDSAAEAAATTAGPAVAAIFKRVALIVLAIQAVLLIAYLVHLAVAPYPDVTRSVLRVLTGDLALLFWGGLVALGLLIPAALILRIDTKKTVCTLPTELILTGFISVLLSSVALRGLMFALGSSIKQFL